MERRGANYGSGKETESQTWAYLDGKGFVRPNAAQRANIVAAFRQNGVVVEKSGFDVVRAEDALYLNSVDEIQKRLKQLRLYEVKTCGAARKSEVTAGFKGLGFTLTQKEHHNAEVLGLCYRFLFVNLRIGTHRECSLNDFFREGRARIYQTWSVFLTEELLPEGIAKWTSSCDPGFDDTRQLDAAVSPCTDCESE